MTKTVSNRAFGMYFIAVFIGALFASVLLGKLPLLIAGFYALMSLMTFVAYFLDKSAAKNNRWRTKESTLHLFSVMGGWPGALLAQKKLRHKSSKKSFKRVYLLTVLFNIGALAWLHTNSGLSTLHSIQAVSESLLSTF